MLKKDNLRVCIPLLAVLCGCPQQQNTSTASPAPSPSGSPSQQSTPPPVAKKPEITGAVTDAFGAPVKDVVVSVKGMAFKSTTDEQGKYAIGYVPGAVVLSFEKPAYSSAEASFSISTESTVPANPVVLYAIPPAHGVYYLGKSGYVPLTRGQLTARSMPPYLVNGKFEPTLRPGDQVFLDYEDAPLALWTAKPRPDISPASAEFGNALEGTQRRVAEKITKLGTGLSLRSARLTPGRFVFVASKPNSFDRPYDQPAYMFDAWDPLLHWDTIKTGDWQVCIFQVAGIGLLSYCEASKVEAESVTLTFKVLWSSGEEESGSRSTSKEGLEDVGAILAALFGKPAFSVPRLGMTVSDRNVGERVFHCQKVTFDGGAMWLSSDVGALNVVAIAPDDPGDPAQASAELVGFGSASELKWGRKWDELASSWRADKGAIAAAKKKKNELAAVKALLHIASAEGAYRRNHERYATLKELGDSRLIDAGIASGKFSGYVLDAGPGEKTPDSLWFATALPENPEAGDRCFFTRRVGPTWSSTAQVVFEAPKPLQLDRATCHIPEGMTRVKTRGKQSPRIREGAAVAAKSGDGNWHVMRFRSVKSDEDFVVQFENVSLPSSAIGRDFRVMADVDELVTGDSVLAALSDGTMNKDILLRGTLGERTKSGFLVNWQEQGRNPADVSIGRIALYGP